METNIKTILRSQRYENRCQYLTWGGVTVSGDSQSGAAAAGPQSLPQDAAVQRTRSSAQGGRASGAGREARRLAQFLKEQTVPRTMDRGVGGPCLATDPRSHARAHPLELII
jgi:hypothetical protein